MWLMRLIAVSPRFESDVGIRVASRLFDLAVYGLVKNRLFALDNEAKARSFNNTSWLCCRARCWCASELAFGGEARDHR